MNTLFSGIILGVGIFIGYKYSQKAAPHISKWWRKVVEESQREENA